MESHYYTPILKSKLGEYGCLQQLSTSTKDHIIPLIEVVAFDPQLDENDNLVDGDGKKKAKKKPLTLTEYLEKKVIKNIVSKWDVNRPFFLDFELLKERLENLPQGVRPPQFVFDRLRAQGFRAIPVTTINAHAAYAADVKRAIAQDQQGVMFRIREVQWYREDLSDKLNKFLDYFGLQPESADLLIDMDFIASSSEEDFFSQTVKLINNILPHVKKWRSLSVGGASFPKDLSRIASNSADTKLPRREWAIWQRLYEQRNSLKRMPHFADYSIVNPELSSVNLKVMDRSAQIRYTLEDEYLVLKGQSLKKNGYSQNHVLSRLLVEKDEFQGKAYSWGDNYIFECARMKGGPGNAKNWRQAENNHHLTLVTNQLSRFF